MLRKDGTLWLNYGDCYATAPNGKSAADYKAEGNDDRTHRDKPFSTVGPVYDPEGGAKGGGFRGQNKGNQSSPGGRVVSGGRLKPKDLCMVSNRLAIALQEDGWWVRSEIIWAKPNPMPESIRDRPTSSHEKLWLLTKAERYYYDAEGVAEQTLRPEEAKWAGGAGGIHSGEAHIGTRTKVFGADPQRRNLRNVWTIATAPFPQAHFATFPPALVEPCIKAGCPAGGTVLDPFGGAGTVGLVADRLQRNAILIELNPQYAEMAEQRIRGEAPLLAEVGT